MMDIRRVSAACLFATAMFAITLSPANADDCAPLMAATLAGAKTPYSATVTMPDLNGHQDTNHVVQTPTKMYLQIKGKWTAMDMSSQELVDQIKATMKTAKVACHRGGTESVNGEAAIVYSVHTENRGSVSDDKIWISAKGLPLKTENHLKSGSVIVSTYDYAHVQPPAGIK